MFNNLNSLFGEKKKKEKPHQNHSNSSKVMCKCIRFSCNFFFFFFGGGGGGSSYNGCEGSSRDVLPVSPTKQL